MQKKRSGISVVVFDMGNTLIHGKQGYEIFYDILRANDVDSYSIHQVKQAFDKGVKSIMERGFLPEIFKGDPEEYWRLFNMEILSKLGMKIRMDDMARIVREQWFDFAAITPYKDTIVTLDTIRKRGYKMAILSNAYLYEIKIVLKYARIDERYFDYLCGFDTFKASKPSPTGLIGLSKVLGVNPYQCVMVGDRHDLDGLAAQNAGTFFIQINRQQKRVKPEYGLSIKCLSELPVLLNNGKIQS